jgi:hypothetical protein
VATVDAVARNPIELFDVETFTAEKH